MVKIGRRGRKKSDMRRRFVLFGLFVLVVLTVFSMSGLVSSESNGRKAGAGASVERMMMSHLRPQVVVKQEELVKNDDDKFGRKSDDHITDESDMDIEESDSTNDHDGDSNNNKAKKSKSWSDSVLSELGVGKKAYPYSLDPVSPTATFSGWTAPGGSRFSEYVSGSSPYELTPELISKSDDQARSRRVHVQAAMKFAWGGYTKYAFGADEVTPWSHRGKERWGNTGCTLVDSLDTLWLMGFKDEFWKARDWIRDHLTQERAGFVSTFETTIRSLGGLLSAYDWSKDRVFLEKAQELGEKLLHAFPEGQNLPKAQVNLNNGGQKGSSWFHGELTAEVGTIQIENRYLSKITQNQKYAQKTEHVFELLNEASPSNGLYPYGITEKAGRIEFINKKITFGAMSDSFYEYMLKIWLQGGKTEPMYRQMYDKAIQGMHDVLVQTSSTSGLTYLADQNSGMLDHKMDHLVCFMGGLLALGAYTDPQGLDSDRAQRDLKTGKALTYTCYQMYARMNTGISAEWIQFQPGNDFHPGRQGSHYLLRPEAFESFFILSYLTKDPIYREWGWEGFSAIERYCKTDIAYGALSDVNNIDQKPRDEMESFFLAETLKYLFLLQDPDTEVDILHKHVFNTEAHPMRIFPVIDDEDEGNS